MVALNGMIFRSGCLLLRVRFNNYYYSSGKGFMSLPSPHIAVCFCKQVGLQNCCANDEMYATLENGNDDDNDDDMLTIHTKHGTQQQQENMSPVESATASQPTNHYLSYSKLFDIGCCPLFAYHHRHRHSHHQHQHFVFILCVIIII